METKSCSGVLYFLFIFSVGRVHSNTVAVLTGSDHTFDPAIKAQISSIDWRYQGNIVVEWEEGNDPIWYRHKERANLDLNTGVLILKKMKKEDNGEYKGLITVSGVIQNFEVTINVRDPLPKPVVNCVVNDTHITLVCSVALPAQFSWSGPNGYTHSGDRVYIARKATGDSIYYCTADNDVSRNVTEFNIVKDCIKDEPSNVSAIVGGSIVGVLCVFALFAVGSVLYLKQKKAKETGTPRENEELKAKRENKDEEANHTSDNQTSSNHQ